MSDWQDDVYYDYALLSMCFEGFLYGIYSGIFAIYLQCVSKESRTGTKIFYTLCLLYVLSTATVVGDLLEFKFAIDMRVITLPSDMVQLQIMLYHFYIFQGIILGLCDFIARCTLIYRCWIVWGKDIGVMIIPSFLAITFITTWLVPVGTTIIENGEILIASWGITLTITGLAASMVVNALVTGLIVFKILKVFLEVKTTPAERTLGSLSSTGGTKLQHIIFIIIESGVALFSLQLVRLVISVIIVWPTHPSIIIILSVVIAIQKMLNGIAPTLILVRVKMKLSFDDKESFEEAVGSLKFNKPPSDPNSLQRVGSSSSMLPQERNDSEDICFDNLRVPSETNIEVRRVSESAGSSSSSSSSNTPLQERSEDS